MKVDEIRAWGSCFAFQLLVQRTNALLFTIYKSYATTQVSSLPMTQPLPITGVVVVQVQKRAMSRKKTKPQSLLGPMALQNSCRMMP